MVHDWKHVLLKEVGPVRGMVIQQDFPSMHTTVVQVLHVVKVPPLTASIEGLECPV